MVVLDHVLYWLGIAGTGIDALLLARVLQLRLQRTYLFITLACVLSLFFDGVQLWLAKDDVGNARVFLYSRLLWAFVYPLVAWDVFEEMRPQIAKLRRAATARLVSGLFFAALFGFIMTLVVNSDQEHADTTGVLSIILWAGSCTASLAFLLSLQRALKAQQLLRPNNTAVWLVFYELTLVAEIVACFGEVVTSVMRETTALDALNICLMIYGIAITVWCAVRLRRIPGDLASPAKADAS